MVAMATDLDVWFIFYLYLYMLMQSVYNQKGELMFQSWIVTMEAKLFFFQDMSGIFRWPFDLKS